MKKPNEFKLEPVLDKHVADLTPEQVHLLLLPFSVETESYVWLAIQGALDLALRHPAWAGESRDVVDRFRRTLLAELVARGLMPAAIAEEARRQDAVAAADNEDRREGRARIVLPGEIVCMHCGCTDRQACANGCHWVQVDREAGVGVCSNCT